jgi:MFS transporter, DHA2 family, integral membrane protein
MNAPFLGADVSDETYGIPEHVYRRRWLTLSVLVTSLVLVVMGVSVVNVALPTFVNKLGASGTELQWIVDAYALVFGGLLLTMGAMGDRWGRRGALQIGLLIIGGASGLALGATDATQLIAVRSVMGLGAALVMPATLSILSVVFPPHERGKAFGIWAAFAGLGGALGPVVGGWLLENFDWPSIFALNLPVILLGLLGTLLFVPSSRDAQRRPLDPLGAFLSILALGALLYGIIEGPNRGWTDALTLSGFAVALVAWPLFVLWELRAKHPMLPMQYFRSRGFTVGNVAVGLTFFVMFAFFFVITQYLQFVRGYSPFEAGLRTLPMAFGMIASAPNSDRLARRLGTPGAVTLGLVLVALSMLGMAFLRVDTPYALLAFGFFLLGVGMGTAMAPSTTLIMDSVPRDKAGVGSAMNDTSREVGGALGIAVLGSILNESYRHALALPEGLPAQAAEAARSGVGGALGVAQRMGPAGASLADAAKDAFMAGVSTSYAWGALVVVITAIVVRFLMPTREAHAVRYVAPAKPAAPEPVTAPK